MSCFPIAKIPPGYEKNDDFYHKKAIPEDCFFAINTNVFYIKMT